jgi:hypothetical protein
MKNYFIGKSWLPGEAGEFPPEIRLKGLKQIYFRKTLKRELLSLDKTFNL